MATQTFERSRTLEEVKTEVDKREGWTLSDSELSSGNSDFISIRWQLEGVSGSLLWGPHNGVFFGNVDTPDQDVPKGPLTRWIVGKGTSFNSNGTEHDDKPWFQALLAIFFV